MQYNLCTSWRECRGNFLMGKEFRDDDPEQGVVNEREEFKEEVRRVAERLNAKRGADCTTERSASWSGRIRASNRTHLTKWRFKPVIH